MRTILFFDLPTLTSSDLRNYRKFVKEIKRIGFYMLQESVYVKMSIDANNAKITTNKVDKIKPKKGSIILLTVTEKQFNAMDILLGENITDVIVSDERTLVL